MAKRADELEWNDICSVERSRTGGFEVRLWDPDGNYVQLWSSGSDVAFREAADKVANTVRQWMDYAAEHAVKEVYNED